MAKQLDARVIRFGRRIKALREATQGLSQEDLALAVGYSRSAIANLETGRLDPVLGRAFELADYFNMSLAQLMSDRGMPLTKLVSDHGVDGVISGPGQQCIAIQVKKVKEFEDNAVNLVRHYAEALRQGQTEGDVQPPVSPERQAFLDLLGQLEDDMVLLCRRHAESLRQGQIEEDVQPPVSPERQAFLDLLGQLEDNTVHLLRRYAEALRQGQTSVAEDLDRQLVYIEDALKLRRFQQGEMERDGTESAPAG